MGIDDEEKEHEFIGNRARGKGKSRGISNEGLSAGTVNDDNLNKISKLVEMRKAWIDNV